MERYLGLLGVTLLFGCGANGAGSAGAAGQAEEGPLLNQAIDVLYAKYPAVVRGPDLWQAFENRTDLIPQGDVHPNDEGREFLREQWARVITSVDP